MTKRPLVLVTGATGYVGGRLVPRLLDAGYHVRVLVRDPSRLQGRPWSGDVEVVRGDVLKPETLPAAMAGVDSAYYLVHSMRGATSSHDRDLSAASHFGAAARRGGVRRIIYLGGLGDPESDLSQHMRSRHLTGDILRDSDVPVTEFRCAAIVGSGSASFEIIRYLTERLPITLVPGWVRTRVQPIAIRDVLSYLVAALQVPESSGKIIEIGGADVLTYRDMLKEYARARGLMRVVSPVPWLGLDLASYWVHLITPVPADIARPLIAGLRNEMVVRDNLAKRLFPEIEPIDFATATRLALARLDTGQVETVWSDALATSQGDEPPVMLTMQEGIIRERRHRMVNAPPEVAFRIFSGIGGDRGWLYAGWTWTIRGAIDRLVGGVGMRRGRRHPDEIYAGEAVDFWRVEAVKPGRLIRLRAEMKVPGPAWLEWEAQPWADGKCRLIQTAYFMPKGLSGLLYWYGLYPIHGMIFSGLIGEIARRAEALAAPDKARKDRIPFLLRF